MIPVHLTFDDGPGPSTARLLDVLRDARCRATFFVLGRQAQSRLALVTRMIEEGHAVGNHTWSHARDGVLSDEQLKLEIAATDRMILQAFSDAGIKPPAVIPLRLPYGVQAGDTRVRVLDQLGRPHVGWTSLFDDWVQPAPAVEGLVQAMSSHINHQARNGGESVLCLHDASPSAEAREATVNAVQQWLALGLH